MKLLQNMHPSRWFSQSEVLIVIQLLLHLLNNPKFNGRKWGNLTWAVVGENKEKELRLYHKDREKVKG